MHESDRVSGWVLGDPAKVPGSNLDPGDDAGRLQLERTLGFGDQVVVTVQGAPALIRIGDDEFLAPASSALLPTLMSGNA